MYRLILRALHVPFLLDYAQNHVDVFITYDSQDWQIAQDKTEEWPRNDDGFVGADGRS